VSIPAFNATGVLPAFLGDPTQPQRSPYSASLVEVVRALGTSPARRAILRGLLAYRAELRRVGVKDGFQWLDGSFVERLGREPNDIDVVTFAAKLPTMASLAAADRDLFIPTKVRSSFKCDAYLVSLASQKLVEVTTYWYGLFSHRRTTLEWKGLVRVALDDATDDASALRELNGLDAKSGGTP